jgi:uncharacterized protein with HEPN domain
MIKLLITHKQFHNIQSIGLHLFRVFICWILFAQSHAYPIRNESESANTNQSLIHIQLLPFPPANHSQFEDPVMSSLKKVISKSYLDYSRGFSKCDAMYYFYTQHGLSYCPMNEYQLWQVQELNRTAVNLISELNQPNANVESVNAHLYNLYQVAYYHVFYYALGIIRLINLAEQTPERSDFCERHNEVIKNFEDREDIQEFCQNLLRVTSDYPASPPKVWTPSRPNWEREFSVHMSPYAPAIFDLVRLVNRETCQTDPSRAKEALEQFLANIKKQEHFDTWISPLLQLKIGIQYLESTSNLGWIRHLWRLIGLIIQEKIPYELKEPNYKKNQATDDPTMQIRMQLYHQLPLAEICAMAIQIHDSEYHSDGEFILSEQNLVHMTDVLRTILPSIRELINFEVDVAEGRSFDPNTTHSQPDFKDLRSFGSHYQDIQNLSKIRKYLNQCLEDKTRLVNTPVGRYAIIRALEVIGEAGKKLSSSTKNPYPLFWKQMAEVRDYFSHLSEEGNAYLQQAVFRDQYNPVFADLSNNLEAISGHVNYLLDQLAHAGINGPDLKDSPKLPDLSKFLEFLEISSNQKSRLKRQILEKQKTLRRKIVMEFDSANSAIIEQADFEKLVDRLLVADRDKTNLKNLYLTYSNQKRALREKQTRNLGSILVLTTDREDQLILKEMGGILSQAYNAKSWEDAQKYVSSWENEEVQLLRAIYDSRQSTSKKTLSLQKALKSIPEISQAILQLSMITKPFGRNIKALTEALNNDPLFYMACEHLISLFRGRASDVIESISWAKTDTTSSDYSLDQHRRLLSDLAIYLHDAMINGNAILHHHDTTEIPFLPATGHYWMMSEYIQDFLDTLPQQIRTYQRLLEAILRRKPLPQPSSDVLRGTLEDNTVLSFTERPLPADNNCGFHGIGISREDAVNQLLYHSSNAFIRSLVAPDIFAAFQSEFMALDSLDLPENYRNHIHELAQARYDAQLKIDTCLRAINDILEPSIGYRMNLIQILTAIAKDLLYSTQVRNEYRENLRYLAISISTSYRNEQSLEAQLSTFSENEDVYRSFVENYRNPTQWLSYVRGATGVLDALAFINNLSIYVWTPNPSNRTQLHLTHRTARRPNPNTIHLIHRDGLTHFNRLMLNEPEPIPVITLEPTATANDTDQDSGSETILPLTRTNTGPIIPESHSRQ